jgi:hypothetical protein
LVVISAGARADSTASAIAQIAKQFDELRRRAAIIKEFSGQDFTPVIGELVKETSKMQ